MLNKNLATLHPLRTTSPSIVRLIAFTHTSPLFPSPERLLFGTFSIFATSLASRNYWRMSRTLLRNFSAEVWLSLALLATLATVVLTIPALELIYVLGGVLLLSTLALMIWKPHFWLVIFTLSLPYWLLAEADPELRLDELLLAAFYLLSVVVWFAKALVARQRIVFHEVDAGILFFFIVGTPINFAIALLNDVEPLRWIRAWGLIATLLLYFPLRDFLRTPRQRRIFFVALIGVTLIAALQTAYRYWLATQNILYAYEVISARVVTNTSLFLGASIATLTAALLLRRWKVKTSLFLVQVVATMALIVSFYRGFWIALLVAITLLFWYLPKRQKSQLLLWGILGISGAILIFALFFKSYMDIALEMLEYRFTSIGKGVKDISLQARLSETGVILDHLARHPLSGYGLGSTFTYYSPIYRYHEHTFYIHNTYLYLSFKFGIPLAAIFFGSLLIAIRRGIQWSKRAPTIETRIYLLSASLLLLGLLTAALTFCVLYQRDALLTFAFALLLLSWGLEQAGYQWSFTRRSLHTHR